MTGATWDRLAPWVGGAAILLAAWLLIASLWPDPPAPDIGRVDRARTEATARDSAHRAEIAALRAQDDSLRRELAAARERESATLAVASVARREAARLADSAAALGETAAAVPVWRDAYAAKSAEAESLRVVAASAQARAEAAAKLANAWRVAHDTATAAAVRWRAIADEERVIRERTTEAARCRIARVLDCPSRTTVGVAGVVLGVAGTLYLTK